MGVGLWGGFSVALKRERKKRGNPKEGSQSPEKKVFSRQLESFQVEKRRRRKSYFLSLRE